MNFFSYKGLSVVTGITKLKNHRFLLPAIIACMVLSTQNSSAQCSINSSSCGYTLSVSITPLAVVPGSNACPNGYNYNVQFLYTINVSGINTCYNDNIGIQPQIMCGSQNNGYYTISVPAPTVGAAYSSKNYTGVLTTTTNPFRPQSDCATANPVTLNCNSIQLTVFGPGIATSNYDCSLVTLPVELTTFKARCESGKVNVEWATATELNNDYFTIERSLNAADWETVKKVDGAGNSGNTLQYIFTDEHPFRGNSYYRLKQTDFNGHPSYSEVVAVKNCNSSLANGDFMIYPNPGTGLFDLQFSDEKEQIRAIEVYNFLGKRIFYSETYFANLDLSGQPDGTYFVNVVLPSQTVSEKIIIKK